MEILRGETKPAALIVEDDENLLFVLEYLLKRENFAIVSAADGRVAVDKIDTMPPPAVALLDFTLPYVDGIQLVGQIRHKPGWKDVPVIMLVPKSQIDAVPQALDAGANDYVLKPFLPNELIAHLRRFFKAAGKGEVPVLLEQMADLKSPSVEILTLTTTPAQAVPGYEIVTHEPAIFSMQAEPIELLPLVREAA
jgi:DNA-binding response OmpR family regulator